MPEETAKAMTAYEVIATIIAIVALVQPWIIKLYNEFFKKLKISFMPSGKIKILYNRSGAYIQIGGVIEAKNRPAIIKNISAKIQRLCDKAELNMEWSSFIVPIYQSIGNNVVTTNEVARPFKIETNSLYPVFIEFVNTDQRIMNRFIEIHNTLILNARSIAHPMISFENARANFKGTPEYLEMKTELLESFYWKASDYILKISIEYENNRVKKYRYKFNLSQDEIVELKDNIEKAMDCSIDNLYGQVPSFYYPQKEFIEAKDKHLLNFSGQK